MPVRSDHDGVSPHWNPRDGSRNIRGVKWASLLLGSDDRLEIMAVKVEWMLAGIVVVQDDLDDIVFLQYEGMYVDAIDCRVFGSRPHRQCRVERGDLGS